MTDTQWATKARAVAVAAQRQPKPKAAITRDRWHRYTYQGVTYPGVTSVTGILDKGGLLRWACRLTAEAAVEQADLLPGLVKINGGKGVVDMLLNRSDKRRDEAADRGSKVHALAELVVRGELLPDGIDPEHRVLTDHVVSWWEESGWRLRLAEAFVVSPSRGYGGTFDLLAYDEQGRTVLADWKTGSGVYGDVRLQLLAYAEAEFVAPQASPVVYPMPRVDRLVVLHVTPTGVNPVDLEVDDLDRQALDALLPLARWHKERKGKVA